MNPAMATIASSGFGKLKILLTKYENRPNAQIMTGKTWNTGDAGCLYFAVKAHQIPSLQSVLKFFPAKGQGAHHFFGPLMGTRIFTEETQDE